MFRTAPVLCRGYWAVAKGGFPRIPISGSLVSENTPSRDCLETPDSSGLRSYELSKRGTESPICPVGHQQNVRLRPHSATFQTASVGNLLPYLCCRSEAGGIGSRSEYLSKRVANCLVEISPRARNLPFAPVLTHKHPKG